ncbi:MAG TPA: Lon-insertion domain-containing protein [Stellaceae bacterium]|nr:Lon-insertion domain-containing protein [Stellaceae bacterium]
MSLATTVSLEPEPIPLDVKVVLIGPSTLYYLLSSHDEEFPDLFKIAADFDDRIARTGASILLYARLVCALARREKLRPLDRGGVSRTVEYASRLAGDSGQMSIEMRAIADLLREADQRAADAGREIVGAAEVQAAIDARIRRGDRIYRRLLDEIAKQTIRIETADTVIGQVNGLSVIGLGGLSFGIPSRITARVRLGRGEVVDIEREVALGGPLHSKGVLILAGFLGGRFGRNRPLSLNASLVFEQSYGGVDGDSASAAELFALLSALAEASITQALAVTGSVDQRGQIQAIGGVNEKIEGFFDACRTAGLDGRTTRCRGRLSAGYDQPARRRPPRRLCRQSRRTRPPGRGGGGPAVSRIERVVVPFDAASDTHNAIAAAVRLAAHAKARLHGVFIEDEDLLHLADLPFARHVTWAAGSAPLSDQEIARQLRGAAARVRQELEAAARRNRVEWSFEVLRLAADAPLAAATERDLVVAGALTRPIGRHFRTEWRWWSSVEQVPGSLLLAQSDWNAGGSVVAVLRDRGPGSARLVEMAARLAEAAAGTLTVICPPQLAGEPGFAAWIAEQAGSYSVPLQIEGAPAAPAELDRRLAEFHCRMLVVSAGAEGRSARLRELFTRFACDILVVR